MVDIRENISLKQLNTFGIDESAAYYVAFHNGDELKAALGDSRIVNQDKLILGGGSNILLTKRFEGCVLHNSMKGMQLIGEDSRYWYVKCGAGEKWHTFVMWSLNQGYGGLENLSLIPGTSGAGPLQNIGAYGVEFKDHFYELEALEIATNTVKTFDEFSCRFGYRESIFKQQHKGKYIVLSITMKLPKVHELKLDYGAIKQQLEKMQVHKPGIKEVSEAVCSIRSSKLPDPAVLGNAGSFFKNPEVSTETCNNLLVDFPDAVSFALPNGNFKIAAGWLIEQCGWKGKRVGNTGSHKDQALVLVNYGGATGNEIYDLAMQIKESVHEKFGIEIMPEVNII